MVVSASCKDSRMGKPRSSLKPELGGVFRADKNGERNHRTLGGGSLKKAHDISKVSGDISESTAIGTTFHGGKHDASMRHDRKTEASDIFEREDESALETKPEDHHRLKTSNTGITDIIIKDQSGKGPVTFKKSGSTKLGSLRPKKSGTIKIKKSTRSQAKAAKPSSSLPPGPERAPRKGQSASHRPTRKQQ